MKLPVKSDYAARAVLGLARQYTSGTAQRVEALARQQGIPPNYLVQILIELKAAGLVRSLRGKEGGYLLARPPERISLGDVIRSVHGAVFDSPALSDPRCPKELKEVWLRLQRALDETANSVTFEQILAAEAERREMYYI